MRRGEPQLRRPRLPLTALRPPTLRHDVDVRLLAPDDAEACWALRLEALESEPRAFGQSAEEHRAMTVADVARRLGESEEAFVFGVFAAGRLRGMAGFYRHEARKARHKGHVWGVYLGPELRGAGVGRALMQALLDRARTLPGIERVVLTVVTAQPAARALYRGLGFTPFGTEPAALKVGGEYVDEEYLVLVL